MLNPYSIRIAKDIFEEVTQWTLSGERINKVNRNKRGRKMKENIQEEIYLNNVTDAFYNEDFKMLEKITGIKVESQIEFEKEFQKTRIQKWR